MPSVTAADERLINILASGKLDEQNAMKARTKLGLDDADIRAWRNIGNTSRDNAEAVRTKVLDKVRVNKGADQELFSDSFKAGLAGAGAGVTFGFSDEITAGIRSGFEKVTKGGDLAEIYRKKVKEERDELKRLENRYPLQFIAGELAGALVVPVPGAAALKGAGIAGKAGLLAAEAALTSAGKAEGQLGSKQFLSEVGKGTLMGTGGGLLLGKAGQKASQLVKKGDKPIKEASKLVSNVLFDLPSTYTERLLDKRTAQKILNPKTAEDIVESITGMTKNMGDHAKALSIKAVDKLDPERNIGIDEVTELLSELPIIQRAQRSNLPEAAAAKKAVGGLFEELAERGGKEQLVSEVDLKRLIQDLDGEIPWNKLEWKLKDKALSEIRAGIDHGILKKNNSYREAMVPVDELMQNLSEISKSFSLKRKGFKTVPSDATFSKVKTFFNAAGQSKKPVTEKALIQAEKRFMGPLKPEILEDIELSQIAQRTEGGQAAGSRNILQGLFAGTLAGFPLWGLVAGSIKDKYGRAVGKKILPDVTEAIKKSDQALKNILDKVDPEQLQRVLSTIGRVEGAGAGVESAQPRNLLLPQR